MFLSVFTGLRSERAEFKESGPAAALFGLPQGKATAFGAGSAP
jgi:hypothetical protein